MSEWLNTPRRARAIAAPARCGGGRGGVHPMDPDQGEEGGPRATVSPGVCHRCGGRIVWPTPGEFGVCSTCGPRS